MLNNIRDWLDVDIKTILLVPKGLAGSIKYLWTTSTWYHTMIKRNDIPRICSGLPRARVARLQGMMSPLGVLPNQLLLGMFGRQNFLHAHMLVGLLWNSGWRRALSRSKPCFKIWLLCHIWCSFGDWFDSKLHFELWQVHVPPVPVMEGSRITDWLCYSGSLLGSCWMKPKLV
jgi:hypothetical protein